VVKVETAQQMLKAVENALPADAAIFAAAVADWRADRPSDSKIKKQPAKRRRSMLTKIPTSFQRSRTAQTGRRLVVGFAAETNDVIANARAKLAKKGCDWIVANDVSPRPASWAAIATPFISSPRAASRTGRRNRKTTWRAA
jgi:phosphopantothenoylcysteine decarboxylase/phosphopantothenate--cysteine ligase